jgi:hypothetical protein
MFKNMSDIRKDKDKRRMEKRYLLETYIQMGQMFNCL